MAGAGYKLFATGDVLTAAQVNTYLNEQTVMVFADSAARTTALSGVLAEGMMSYLQDTDSVEVYDGTSWTAIGGGGLSSPLTTKGDVWGYSTTDARIPVGANGTVLTADSVETLGVKWAAPAAGGGKVLQVVFASSTTTKSSTSTTYADTDITATITPSSASSKVLVMVVHAAAGKNADASNGLLQVKLMRGATEISNSGDVFGNNNVSHPNFSELTMVELDSPATTSATTYKTQYRSPNGGSGSAIINNYYNTSGEAKSTITLMEIGA
jgi:trimeric autotransporter adhesin